MRGALSCGGGGCLCQWELKAPTDISQSDCVHEQVAKRIANVRFTGEKSEKKLLFIQQNGCAAVTGQWCIRKERTGVMRMGEKRDAYVKLDKVSKIYGTKEVKIVAVDEISFEIASGEFVVIVGPSGAGKTTVLNILGGMDQASSGEVWVDGKNIAGYNSRQLTGYRRNDIGFVFQFYNLVPNLTALENVELALQICKNPLDAREVLEEVGLKDRLTNFPAQLSGGEQQRVSIARALAKNPKLLLCDEPTGALDYQTGKAILKLLQDMCRERGMTVIVITHNSALTPMADRVIKIKNGKVSRMTLNDHPTPVEEIEW